MKKFLIFIGGFVAGIIATIFVAFVMVSGAKNHVDSSLGLTVFPEKGECITIEKEIQVFEVLEPNMALAGTGYNIRSGFVVLLVNYEGKTYYDKQVINIPAGKCARQIGIYKYIDNIERVKTLPAVVIE